jgi:hypothetical protein
MVDSTTHPTARPGGSAAEAEGPVRARRRPGQKRTELRSDAVYSIESDLSGNSTVTAQEIEALARLLGGPHLSNLIGWQFSHAARWKMPLYWSACDGFPFRIQS